MSVHAFPNQGITTINVETTMASDAERSPKARHRFGFSGKRKRTVPNGHLANVEVSSDDILDSLTKQAASQIGTGNTQTRTLELLDEIEPTLSNSSEVLSGNEFIVPQGKGFGRYAIVLMGVAGMVAVWFFSFGRTLISSNILDLAIQRTNVRSVFANPGEIGIVSAISLGVASWLAIRRRSRRLQLSP